VKTQGIDYKGTKTTQYNMFERRFADKLTYFDWKLGFLLDEKDVGILISDDKLTLSQEVHRQTKPEPKQE
jgi:hypothetical protein